MNLEQHALSAAFPPMPDDEFESLSKSIEQLGLLSPIVLFESKVIDGWHRYSACMDTLTAIKTIEYTGNNPQEFVIAQNKERRHLTKSQIATAAIKVYEWLKDGVKQGSQASSAPSAELKSSKEIAEIAGVSTKTIDEAKKVEKQATPEIKEAIVKGEMSVSAAVKQMAKQKLEPVEAESEYSEIDQLRDENSELLDVIKDLQHQLSIGNYEGAEPIEEIIKELKMAQFNLKQVTQSRNGLMNELAGAKLQIIQQRKELDKLKK